MHAKNTLFTSELLKLSKLTMHFFKEKQRDNAKREMIGLLHIVKTLKTCQED